VTSKAPNVEVQWITFPRIKKILGSRLMNFIKMTWAKSSHGWW